MEPMRSSISTGSPRSTRPSSTRRAPTSHMHVGARSRLRGPAAALRRTCSTSCASACTSCRATARSSASRRSRRGRPLWVDDPTFNLEYHVRQTALPRPGQRGAAAAPGRADLLPAARPLQAAVGDLAGRGPRRRPLRADLQDPPRADRRRRRRRPRARSSSTSSPVPQPRSTHPGEPWRPAPEPTPRRAARRRHRGAAAHAAHDRPRRRAGALAHAPETALKGAREAAEGLGEVAWAGLNPAPETPLNVEIGPAPPLRRRAHAARRLQDGQGRVRRDGQRRRARGRQRRAARLAAVARRAHRGPGAARARAGLDPRRGRARHSSATASPRCAGRCPSTSTTRSRACSAVREAHGRR